MKKLSLLILIVSLFTFAGCSESQHYHDQVPIKLKLKKTQNITLNNIDGRKNALQVAISAMISPKETFSQYQNLLSYISKKLGMPIELKQRKTYSEINDLLKSNELDFAFICSGAYVRAKKEFPIKLLAIPVVNGKPYYQAFIIVNKNSSIKKFSQLRNKSFAFTDPLSNTGYNYAITLLKKMGETPDKFFSKTIFTYAHDYSIQAVARGIVDGASVDGLIFNYLKKFYPKRVAQVKIIKESKPFGIPPFVYPPGANKQLIAKIRQILLNMNKSKEGKKILSSLMIDKFIEPDVHLYDSIKISN